MFSMTTLLAYVAACFLFTIVPGPSVTVVVANSLARGTKAGLLTIVGTEIAMLSMIFVVALGLQAVMTAVSSAFTIIKLAGAAYLVWIGWKMFTSTGHLDFDKRAERLPLWRYVLQGAVINWSNPKTLLFLGAFLPQFVDMTKPAFPQIMVLGLIVVVIATSTDSIYAVLAGRMGTMLTAARVRVMNRVSGVVLMCAALWLALLKKAQAIYHLPELSVLIPYTIAAFVVVAVPGITVSTVISTALARGLVPAYWFELGAGLSRLSMVIVVAVALQAVTGIVSALFDIIKYAGAIYLLYLGIRYLISRRAGITVSAEGSALPPWQQVATGFLTLWGNPKALLFFGAFIPQFVDPRYTAWPQVLVLGLIEIVAAFITDSGYIALSVGARSLLTGGGLVWVNRVAGVILIGASIWLATLHR